MDPTVAIDSIAQNTEANSTDSNSLNDFILVVTILMMITGVFGNILVIASVYYHRPLRTLSNTFIVNLAVSDLCVSAAVNASGISALLTDGQSLISKPVLCEFLGSVCITSCISSVLNIAAISINRYFKICKYTYYHKIYNKRTIPCMVVLFWLFCFLIDLPSILGWGNHEFGVKFMLCTYVQSHETFSYSLFFFLVGFITPWMLSGIAYLNIFLFTRKANENLKRSLATGNPNAAGRGTRKPIYLSEMRIVRSTFTIWCVFLIMWSPYAYIIMFDRDYAWSDIIYTVALICAHSNSSINCILYILTNKHFRDAYQRILTCGRYTGSGRVRASETLQHTDHASRVVSTVSAGTGVDTKATTLHR